MPSLDPNPIETAYYATGQWHERQSNKPEKTSYTAHFEKQDDQLVFSGRISKKVAKAGMPFFRPDPSKCPYSEDPLSIASHPWMQEPVPESLYTRLPRITANSGHFVIYVPEEKFHTTWQLFRESYSQGALGYGLQCSTGKVNYNQKNRGDQRIVVFIEDSYDIDEVTRVAKNIFSLTKEWDKPLKFCTDRTIKARYSYSKGQSSTNQEEKSDLYTIDSPSLLQGTIQTKLYFAAQARYNLLINKKWSKFKV